MREAAGERSGALELEIGAYFTLVCDTPEPMAAGLGKALGLPAEAMLRHPHALFGPPEARCDELMARREHYGVSYVTVPDSALESFAPVVARRTGS